MRSLLALSLFVLLTPGAFAEEPREPLTAADVERMITDLSNWGRWGKDDELGALNLITPAKRKQAAGLVRDGLSVSLARRAETDTAADNPKPFEHTMLSRGKGVGNEWATDNFSVSYHGYAHTHMDALCHLLYRDRLYNGFPQSTITDRGAQRLSIHRVAQRGILTRGLLIDIPRLRKVDYLEPGEAIFPEELDKWERETGVKVTSGDVVFLRTGRWERRRQKGAWDVKKEGLAGLHASCAKWLRERDVAMLGSDAGSDVIPSQIDGMSHPVHILMLHAMGVPIFDNCDLEALGKTAAKLKRWEFMLYAAPIPVNGGTGSPLNPIATF